MPSNNTNKVTPMVDLEAGRINHDLKVEDMTSIKKDNQSRRNSSKYNFKLIIFTDTILETENLLTLSNSNMMARSQQLAS